MADLHERRFGPRDCAHVRAHGIRCHSGNVVTKQLFDPVRILIWNEPEAQLRRRSGRNDSLSANSLIATGESVDRERRTYGRSFREAVARLAPTTLCLRVAKEDGIGRADARQIPALRGRDVKHIVVNAFDCNPALPVVKAGDDCAERVKRIVDCASEDSGMQIA